MIPFGSDFAFQFASANYDFLDRLMTFSKENPLGKKFLFKYSTVDEYFTAVKEEGKAANITWPLHTGDFFPYNGVYAGSYWSGYYTSRSGFKKLIRDYTGAAQSV